MNIRIASCEVAWLPALTASSLVGLTPPSDCLIRWGALVFVRYEARLGRIRKFLRSCCR